ncbi:hypothetical protein BN946_scf184887.g7 [Trametes cinnabarina]|uniref:Uncharacterized protein n=1 Tax=Pycnoporus cinnabarinus TaxID=5643 RepID=A0A060T120_PYCCI|nr:hypothetical protein BN946_scf184887.g7 [Trametes cinnabarina]
MAGNLSSEPAPRQPWQELNLSALTEMLGHQDLVSHLMPVLIESAKYLLHPVPYDTLMTIINTSKPKLFDLSDAHCSGYAVQLTVNLKKEHKLGKVGGFKTAHPAVIHIDQQRLKEIILHRPLR